MEGQTMSSGRGRIGRIFKRSAIVLPVIVLIGMGLFFFAQYKKESLLKSRPNLPANPSSNVSATFPVSPSGGDEKPIYGTERYRNEKYGLEFEYLPGWTAEDFEIKDNPPYDSLIVTIKEEGGDRKNYLSDEETGFNYVPEAVLAVQRTSAVDAVEYTRKQCLPLVGNEQGACPEITGSDQGAGVSRAEAVLCDIDGKSLKIYSFINGGYFYALAIPHLCPDSELAKNDRIRSMVEKVESELDPGFQKIVSSFYFLDEIGGMSEEASE